MHTLLAQILEQLNSSVFVLIAILWVCFWIVYRVGKWTETFSTHSKKIDASDEQLKSHFQNMAHITARLDLIYANTLKTPLVRAHSPLSLTETGVAASEAIGLERVLSREFSKLAHLVNEKSPQSAYDIHIQCMHVVTEQFLLLLTELELSLAKDFAFANGLQLEDLAPILAVLLRNEILMRQQPISFVSAAPAQAALV